VDETAEIEAPCPHCGAAQVVRVWESANAERFPELVPQLLESRLNVVVCERCARPFGVERELLWTQLAKGWYISVYPRNARERVDEVTPIVEAAFEGALGSAPVAVQLALRSARRRLVFGLDELREKELCIEGGVDDADLEMTKLTLLQRHPEWCAVPGMTGLVLAALEPEALVFRFVDADEPESAVAVPRSVLDRVHEARPDWATECYFPPPYVHLSRCVSLL
jgi:hypothetical protein